MGAFQDLSLYTNAESCPMCASAIRSAGFKEYIYGTSIKTLTSQGWGQIQIPSSEVFHRSTDLPSRTSLIGDVLTNETDPYFAWQYNTSSPCPATCKRDASGTCAPAIVNGRDQTRFSYRASVRDFVNSAVPRLLRPLHDYRGFHLGYGEPIYTAAESRGE